VADQWDGVNRRDYDRQLTHIDKKLDEHSARLEELRQTLSAIAVQSVQIISLQAMQNEMRGDISELYAKIEKIMNWQSSCPKDSVNALWGVFLAVSVAIGGAFVAHVIGGK
jgi:hypothetical protein